MMITYWIEQNKAIIESAILEREAELKQNLQSLSFIPNNRCN